MEKREREREKERERAKATEKCEVSRECRGQGPCGALEELQEGGLQSGVEVV